MKTAGIIAEYNPFHNGHAYQIEEVRRQTGADYVIIVMSGDFVQRGEPSIVDKYLRTRMHWRAAQILFWSSLFCLPAQELNISPEAVSPF